jgi:hypothetical protein
LRNRRTAKFRELYAALPARTQQRSREVYRLFLQEPSHPSLRFKQVNVRERVYSIRIDRGIRALARREDDALVWFWIGTHADYDKLLRSI